MKSKRKLKSKRKPKNPCECMFTTGASLLEFLQGRLRLRFESKRKRLLDMRDVIHLEILLPGRDAMGRGTGDSCWTSISVTGLEE